MIENVRVKLLKWIAPRSRCNEPCPEGYSRINDSNPEDIFIAGYPKSGNTWMQELVACLQYGLDISRCPDSLIQELVPDTQYKKFYKRFKSPVVFKTHDFPRPNYRRVINIVRDGRDVISSYKAYNDNLGVVHSIDDMIRTGAGLFPGFWHDHVEAWLANPYGAAILLVRYEDLKNDTVRQLQRISEFVSVHCQDPELEAIAAATTVGKMKEREKKYGWDDPFWRKENSFVRKGLVGAFGDNLSTEQVVAIEHAGAAAFHKLGYFSDDRGRD